MSSSSTALKTFSLENDVLDVSANDEIYRFDAAENRRINREEPWKKEYGSRAVFVSILTSF
jgi:COP9 signalosome complex subunit 5